MSRGGKGDVNDNFYKHLLAANESTVGRKAGQRKNTPPPEEEEKEEDDF
jgi:hypothetical protein